MEGDILESVSNALSTITILSCLFLKVPQILYIREKKSAEGIYIQAMLMEVAGFSIMCLYNYNNKYGLLTYMEYPLILFQVYVLFYYVLKYKRMLNLPIVLLLTALYFTIVAGFLLNILPKQILSFLVPFCTPLSGFAKVTYMYGIVRTANADAVSLSTWIISVLTNLARVFTVYVDSADGKLMINFAISTFLSAGVLFTALYYQSYDCYVSPRLRRRTTNQPRRQTHDF